MALDPGDRNLRMGVQDLSHVVEDGMGASLELRTVRVEVDLVEDLEPAVFDDHVLLLRATLVCERARLVRAVVDSVGDAVTVAVGIRIDDDVLIRIHLIHDDDFFLPGHRVAEHADQPPIGIAVPRGHAASAGDTHRKAFGMEVLEAADELDR